MTEKDNFLGNIRFQNFERITGRIPAHFLGYFGCNHANFEGQGHHSPVGTSWNDIWGVTWHRDLDGVMGFPKVYPLADLGNLDGYTPPDIDDERYHGAIFERKKSVHAGDHFIAGSHRDTLWERAYMLVGMEDLMCYFHTEPEKVKTLLKMIMDFQLRVAEYYIKAGVELVHLTDDLGTQSNLLLGRGVIEEFLVPEYRRLIDFYKSRNVIVDFHSCGHVEPMLDIFMELGVDILNPVQASANDLAAVRRATQGKMALMGGISSAVVMDGTPKDVEAAVRDAIDLLGREGGYICCPDQFMPYPSENSEAFQEAVDKYGVR